MCGITGWIHWERDLRTQDIIVEKMAQTLDHRGPDEKGMWISPRAALVHRRLIVIDPQGGKQPMVKKNGAGTFVIVYNGELYNTQELRNILEKKGYIFTTRSDTEVILNSYIEWKEECVHYLNGIFAFAVWSERDQSLYIARDRFGVKPLFYLHRERSLIFGSELKAVLAHPEVSAEIDSEGMAEILALGPARTPGHGVFKGIKELKPGFYLVFNRKGLRKHCYFKLKSRIHKDNAEKTIEKTKILFKDAVERQMVSDMPLCTLLSGGLDSSAISAYAAGVLKSQGKILKTFSVDFAGNERYFKPNEFQPSSDDPWVKIMSQYLGTEHHRIILDTPQLIDSLKEAVRARDLPGMADVDSSLYLFSREIKQEATVALSGECADEVFCGYPWFYRKESLTADTFPWALGLSQREKVFSKEVRSYCRFADYAAERYSEALKEVPRLPGENSIKARLREISYLTLTRWMPVLLDRKDRMSMAAGLEIRVPFCDHRLVEYVFNVPWELKNYGGREKGLLRASLTGVLPEKILQRKKSPYPKTHNPSYLKGVRKILLEIINSPSSPLGMLVDKVFLKKLLFSEKDLDVPWFGQLMRLPQLFAYLIQVDFWFREYKVSIK